MTDSINEIADHQILRRCVFTPYRKGMGPTFRLTTWDTYRRDNMGKCILGYRLRMCQPGTILILFEGEDFGCSPCHAIDSDAAVASLMGFLTLKPGDTDSEYFDGYSDLQRDYCSEHAEALQLECMNRFG